MSDYLVSFKQPTGLSWRDGVVSAGSPRQALAEFCKRNNRLISSVYKYSSWYELQQAFLSRGGNCTLCEVCRKGGDRKNYYVIYTTSLIGGY